VEKKIFVIDTQVKKVFELVSMDGEECVIKNENYGHCRQSIKNLIVVPSPHNILIDDNNSLKKINQELIAALEKLMEVVLLMEFTHSSQVAYKAANIVLKKAKKEIK
jgi:hypothetical protein